MGEEYSDFLPGRAADWLLASFQAHVEVLGLLASAVSKLSRMEQSVKIFTSEYVFFIGFSCKGNRFEDLLKEVRLF